jgi:hypothetical protein
MNVSPNQPSERSASLIGLDVEVSTSMSNGRHTELVEYAVSSSEAAGLTRPDDGGAGFCGIAERGAIQERRQ